MTEPDSSVSLPSDLTEDPPNNKYGSNDDQHYSRVSHSQDGRNTTRKQFSHQTNNTSVRDIQIDDKHQKSQRQVNVTDGFHSIPDSSAAFSDVGAESFNAFQYARGSNAPNSLTRTQSLDSDIPVTSPHESVEEYQRRSQDICSAYLMGQLSNVAKAAVWWSTFGVVAEALTKIALAVGTTRLVFNLALVLMSPLAGTVAENTNIQTLLNYTTWGRLFIWCCCIPASWFYFASYLGSFTSFYVCFLILMFLDGIQVSFANVVDIDCGGLDTLATQYKLSIGSYLRDRFNRIHQIVFDLSFILLTPPVAFLIWQIAFRFDHHNVSKKTLLSYVSGVSLPGVEFDTKLHYAASFLQQGDGPTTKPMETGEAVDTSENTDIAVLMIGICGVFGILSIYSLWSYWGHLSTKSQRQSLQYSNEQDIVTQSGRSEHTTIESSGSLSSWQMTWSRFHDVKDGFLIVLGEPPLGWRLLFLALETALEDAIVSVVIPQVALQMTPLLWKTFYPSTVHLTPPSSGVPLLSSQYFLPPILPGGWTFVNFIAVSLIAIGKSGGLASGAYMSSRWIAPSTIEKSGPYSILFRYMFYSSAALLALPLAYFFLMESHPFQALFSGIWSSRTIDIIRGTSAIVLVTIAGFLFFVFSTAPKIGFATLLHALVVQRDIDPKVFGFVGTFVTITDAVIILVLNLVFALCGGNRFLLALLISSGIYLLNGIAELLLGPRLILESPAALSSDDQAIDFPNIFRYNQDSNQSPIIIEPDNFRSNDIIIEGYKTRLSSGGGVHEGRVIESSAREFGRDEASIVRNQLDRLEPMVGSWARAN